ncbi:hypothetical protein [Streptomyces sp. NPDC055709]
MTDSLATTPSWNTNNSWWNTYLMEKSFAHGNPTFYPGVQAWTSTAPH